MKKKSVIAVIILVLAIILAYQFDLKSGITGKAVYEYCQDGVVGYWPLSDNLEDYSGNENDGTSYGNAKILDNALILDGIGDYVDLDIKARDLGIDGNNPKSVSAWVWTNDAINIGGIVEMGSNEIAKDFTLELRGYNFWIAELWGLEPSFVFDTHKKWVHFVMTTDGSNVRVYANGNQVKSYDVPPPYNELDTGNAKTIKFGKWYIYEFPGKLKEISIFDKQLSQQDVADLYNSGTPVSVCPSPSCTTDADCNDGDVCTTDSCQDGNCENTAINNCCEDDGDCDSGEICQANQCVEEQECQDNSECDDENICTTDTCNNNVCVNTAIQNCCISGEDDCAAGENCVNNQCTSDCTPNWTPQNTSCSSSGVLTTYYIDTNNCGETPPANQTHSCIYTGRGVIGNFSNINSTNIAPSFYINGSSASDHKNYSNLGSQKIEIKDSNEVIVEFDWNFSQYDLNLDNLYIETQNSSDEQGYLLIRGILTNKTVFVERINNSDTICVRNSDIISINSITENCERSYEKKIECPGNSGSIKCSISGDYFEVTGLTSSGVIEMLEQDCNVNWTCTSWSSCVNNSQTRTCIDSSSCGILTGKPNEIQSCGDCIESWSCTDWNPEKCPRAEEQTRDCIDLKSCGTTIEKPSETRDCEYEKPSYLFWIITFVLAALIVVITIIIINAWNKNEKKQVFSPPKGPKGPMGPMNLDNRKLFKGRKI